MSYHYCERNQSQAHVQSDWLLTDLAADFALQTQNIITLQAVAPCSGPLQFDFVKDWTAWYVACAINSNAVNSTGLGHGLQPTLTAGS